jgi:hypothetical protein
MHRFTFLVALGFVSCLSACGGGPPAKVNLRAVLDEAGKNLTEPTLQLRKGPVELRGVVQSAGIRPFREVKKDGEAEERQDGQYPFLIIVPGDARPGRCLCFFENADMDVMLERKPGAQIAVIATFERFASQEDQLVLIADCKLTE